VVRGLEAASKFFPVSKEVLPLTFTLYLYEIMEKIIDNSPLTILISPVLDSLGDMSGGYFRHSLQVGNGAGNFKNSGVGPNGLL